MGAFQLNCKLKRIFYSSASGSAGISRESKGWKRRTGRTGRIASQQELSLPFPAAEKFFFQVRPRHVCRSFRTENTGHNLVSDSANFERAQVKSNHPSWRSDLAGADTPVGLRDDSPPLYLPVASTPRVVARPSLDQPAAGFPRSGSCGNSLIPLRRPSCTFAYYFARPPFNRGILFTAEIACETRNAPPSIFIAACDAEQWIMNVAYLKASANNTRTLMVIITIKLGRDFYAARG